MACCFVLSLRAAANDLFMPSAVCGMEKEGSKVQRHLKAKSINKRLRETLLAVTECADAEITQPYRGKFAPQITKLHMYKGS